MSKLRLTTDMIFAADDPAAQAAYDDLVALAARLQTITSPDGRPERSRIELHRCHHDEAEPGPCEVLDGWESA